MSPRRHCTRRRRGGATQSTRRRYSTRTSTQNTSNVIHFDSQHYQQSLIHHLIQPFNDETINPENPYIVYDVDECIRNFLHDYFIFQTPTDFSFDWLKESKRYVGNLTNFQKNILRSYTRHGDELINAYLRDPEGFHRLPKVHELLFDTMPHNFSLPFASQLAEDFISQNMEESYIEDDFFDSTGDVRELGQRVQDMYINAVLRQTPVDWISIRGYLDRYIKEFHTIFYGAPQLQAPLLVFRGVTTDYMNRMETPVLMKGYISTTYSVDVASIFAGEGKRIYEMLLLPGTPCIAMETVSEFEGSECEILVDSNVYAIAERKYEKKRLHPFEGVSEPLTPAIVIDGENEAFTSRLVVVHPPNHEGGYLRSPTATTATTATTAITTDKTIRRRNTMKKTKKQTGLTHMIPRADPIPIWGYPIPAWIQGRLQSALESYRSHRIR